MRPYAARISITVGALAMLAVGVLAQEIEIVPRLTGPADPMEAGPAPPIPDTETFETRPMRSYPEQPPVIPHSIEGYQLTLAANRCLECHRRQYTSLVGAPMISITHFMDRHQQMLADVSPRRYFCTTCHVPQTESPPLVDNTYRDMLLLNPQGAE
jgi:nitrate reductase (cytochrome), electron transfer subunit